MNDILYALRKTRLLLVLVLASFCSVAQSSDPDSGFAPALELDHSTILVADIEKSVGFYREILRLKELETPWPDNPLIRFFGAGKNQQLHIAQVENDGLKLNKVVHTAFAVQEFDTYLAFLEDKGIEYSNFDGDSQQTQTRPDGVRQIYLQDPDGYWIEINDAKH